MGRDLELYLAKDFRKKAIIKAKLAKKRVRTRDRYLAKDFRTKAIQKAQLAKKRVRAKDRYLAGNFRKAATQYSKLAKIMVGAQDRYLAEDSQTKAIQKAQLANKRFRARNLYLACNFLKAANGAFFVELAKNRVKTRALDRYLKEKLRQAATLKFQQLAKKVVSRNRIFEL